MKTLANFKNYHEFYYPVVKFGRGLFQHNLTTLLELFDKKQIKMTTTGKKGKVLKTPYCSIYIEYQGKKFLYDRVLEDVSRIYNLCEKSPEEWGDIDTSDPSQLINWIESNASEFLKLSTTKVGRTALFQFAQVVEKGLALEYRKLFGFGKVNNSYMKGKMQEVLCAEHFQKTGGTALIESAEKSTIDKDGSITQYKTSNRDSKKLDLKYTGRYVITWATHKTHSALLDGGGRNTEYESDAAKTIQKATARFETHGYEFDKQGRLILVMGLVDSRFFAGAHGPNAIRLMQQKANNKNTFITNSQVLAQFMNLIDVPEVLTDTDKIIAEAFDKLAVEV
jgi:hypothetical protein